MNVVCVHHGHGFSNDDDDNDDGDAGTKKAYTCYKF